MGILDEAIREHLELKRKRGATDSELQRLEDEAFGPPSRPGEPDFPETGEEPAEQSGNGVAREAAVAEPPASPEAPTAPPSEEGEHDEAEPAVEAAATEEPAPVEGPQAESPSEPAAPPADEPPADAEEQTAIYDQTAEGDPELGDLDLELADEATPSDEPPIESLDTVEHALPEQEAPPEAPPSEEPAHEPPEEDESSEEEPEPASEEDEASAEGEPEEEDVLADTPDFLKDAPEDDELWFEQGKPKDFDF
jgi:hypothetical protein